MYSQPTFLRGQEHTDRIAGGAPRVLRADGSGKRDVYSRVTSYVGQAEDRYNLDRWTARMLLVGLARDPELAQQVYYWREHYADRETRESKAALDALASKAKEAAMAGRRAALGTLVHGVTEHLDAGMTVDEAISKGVSQPEFKADLEAYMRETAHIEAVAAECFVVNDQLRTAGTLDRMVRVDGELFVADIKTGSTVELGAGKHAEQIALYAHSDWYDAATGARVPLAEKFGAPVSLERGLLIHLPYGEGRCHLHWIDLVAGWDGVALSQKVKQYRKYDSWLLGSANLPGIPEAIENLQAGGVAVEQIDPVDALTDALHKARTVDELYAIHSTAQHIWTDAHTAVAAARKAQLAQTA